MDELVALVEREVTEPFLQSGTLTSQVTALYVILIPGGILFYLLLSTLSYAVFFKLYRHRFHPPSQPQPFPGQEWAEIRMSLGAVPLMATLTVPFFLLQINGYSRLYRTVSEYGWGYLAWSSLLFLLWSDAAIYAIHRGLHQWPWAYRNLHKDHHAWKVPTPFAAIAFHPVDGWLQSLPYLLFPFALPFHARLSLGLFLFVQLQVWTVLIHDGADLSPLPAVINGAAHHSLHHSRFYFNYGQYFTAWDRLCGTFAEPRGQ